MKSCTSLLVAWVIIGILAFFLFPKGIEAYYFFSDYFNSTYDSSWTISPEATGSAKIVSDSFLRLSPINSKKFPYLWKEIPILDKVEIEFKFRFAGTPNFGAGLVLSDKLLPYGITREVAWDEIVFVAWPQQVSGFAVSTVICPNTAPSCTPNLFNSSVFKGLSNEWYTLKMQKDGNKYYLYIDGTKVYESLVSERQIRYIWLGNPGFTNGVAWPIIDIDYIKVSELRNTSQTIMIPGLGASWDIGAILSGTDGNNWTVPSFVKEYDGLISSFINTSDPNDANPNLYVFPYDWRQPLSVLAERLKTYIDTHISTGEKVNLVGHSMGGLVARAYTQTYGTSKINKVITVGSPNKGVTETYGVWEGATIWNDVWWAKVALELTTHFGANVGESNVQTIQRLVPSLRDLLPIYDFLKKDGLIIPWSTLSQKNLYLSTLNQDVSQIDSLTTAIYSNDVQTNNIVNVIAPSEEDLALYRWIDGKPSNNPFEIVNGDGTVTEESAKGIFSNILEGSGWHGELVTKTDNIQKIFGVLGLDQTKALSGVADDNREVFVVALRSPGKLDVCDSIVITKCNDQLGLYFPDDKLFMLPGYNNEELVVKITEEGTKGQYKLHLGDIGDVARWSVVGGDLNSTGQVDRYDIQVDGTGITARLIDEIPPSIPTGGLPNGSYSSTNEFDFTWDASTDDRSGEVAYEFQSSMNPAQAGGILTTGLWRSGTLPNNMIHSTGASDGIWYWQVRAKDIAGNFSAWSQVWTVTLDHLAPTSTFSLPPLLNVWSGKIIGTAIDNVSGVAKVDLIINDPLGFEDIVIADGTTNWSYTITSPVEGKYIIRSRASDVAGNVEGGIEGKQIIFDITAPTITIITPTAGIFQSWNLPEVSYSVVDNFDDSPDVNVSGWSTNEGVHTVSVLAIDDAGNQSSKSVTYTIKNPPTNIEQCKKGGWELYRLFGFKNQGQCASSIQRNERASARFFWWI